MDSIELAKILPEIRRRRPLVYNIANIVTSCDCANATLAIGASPLMGLEPEEASDLVNMAGALVINIGTATKQSAVLMEECSKAALSKGIPIVLDPVGAGASRFRTNLSIRLIENFHPIIRCNYSEFLTLAGIRSETRGVDSVQNDFYDIETISSLARALKTVIAVTGHHDVITDGKQTAVISNGSRLMEDISGTGCMCSSLVGAAVAVTEDHFKATTAAIALMSVCGEKSAENFKGTASMKNDIIDCLSTINEDEFTSRLRILL